MTTWSRLRESNAGFVEVLASQETGMPFGYRLIGQRKGPQIVVAGVCKSADRVFDRLLTIPTLPWLRGNLILLQLDVLHDLVRDIAALQPVGQIDRTVVLPWSSGESSDALLAKRGYHSVLRACADLGMISGRGVSSALSEA